MWRIDLHNWHCQDNLKMAKKLETKKWDMQVNLTIFSMIIVDTWLCYAQCTNTQETLSNFYSHLGEELIDNNINNSPTNAAGTHQRDFGDYDESLVLSQNGQVHAGIAFHLMPTKCHCCKQDG